MGEDHFYSVSKTREVSCHSGRYSAESSNVFTDGQKLLGKRTASRARTWEESLEAAAGWLSTCQTNHEKCRVMVSPDDYVPKRLLSVDQPNVGKVRIVSEPWSKDASIRYATLSHCWGSSKPLKLTSGSLSLLEAGIEVQQLPQVFQDAVSTSRSLGIQFLWIDSLCILQDSKRDWDEQAPQMSQIYRNGCLNIAMSAAANSSQTCFQSRDHSQTEPCIVRTDWDACPNDEYHIYHNDIWQDLVESKPLSKRAWIVQELILPPRVLYLSGQQLSWECYQLTACETYPGGLPRRNHDDWLPRDALWHTFKSAKAGGPVTATVAGLPREIQFRKQWSAIVRMYTQRNLTITTDRLIALAGIAKAIGAALKDDYCAGLWKRNLAVEMFWFPPSSEGTKPRPNRYRAPSWSWASLEGQSSPAFFADESTIERLISIIDCHVDTTTGDPFSVVTTASLTVCGWLATVTLRLRQGSTHNWSMFLNGSWYDDNMVYIALDCALPHLQLHCLPVILDNHQAPSWNLSCILLVATGARRGQFQRAGVLHVFQGGRAVADWKIFESPKNEDWLEYEAENVDGTYRVSII